MTLQEALKYSTNRTHSDFVDAALAQPKSEVHPLVYTDWLQEQGQEGLAEQIRKAVQYNRGDHRGYTRKGPFKGVTEPLVFVSPVFDGVYIVTAHPSSNGESAAFHSRHSPEDPKRLLDAMVGVKGQEQALRDLSKKHPHLFTEPE